MMFLNKQGHMHISYECKIKKKEELKVYFVFWLIVLHRLSRQAKVLYGVFKFIKMKMLEF